MYKIVIVLILVAFILISAGCYTNKNDYDKVIKDYRFHLVKIPYDSLYRQFNKVTDAYNATPTDSDSVQIFLWKEVYHYHPVQLAHRSLDLISDYRLTKDKKYLNRAIKNVEALLSRAVRVEKGIYFPYTFDYNVLQKPEIELKQPWFSGMAQGMLLSTFCRLYYITHNKSYRAVADSILYTLSDYSSPYSTILVSENDSLCLGKSYYWIDEYPHPIRVYVLNGSIIGAMGLYDHWWVFRDKQSKKLLSQELTTIKDHALLYRNPNDLSSYDLKYRSKFDNYHLLHIDLMKNCYDITSNKYFKEVRDSLVKDFHK
jgi:hypothetical protein